LTVVQSRSKSSAGRRKAQAAWPGSCGLAGRCESVAVPAQRPLSTRRLGQQPARRRQRKPELIRFCPRAGVGQGETLALVS